MIADLSTPILIVEEQAGAVTFILDALDVLGYEDVELAANGTAALDLLRRNGPRLVLADLHMVPVSGLELLRTIRSDHKLYDSPFVMTARGVTAGEAVAVKHAGGDALLLKPFTSAALASKIDAARTAREAELTSQKQIIKQSSSGSLGRRFGRRWSN